MSFLLSLMCHRVAVVAGISCRLRLLLPLLPCQGGAGRGAISICISAPPEEAARTSVKPPAPVGAAATAPPPLRLPPPSPSESDGAGSDSGSAPSSKSKSSVSAKLRIGAKRPYPSACAAAASVGTDQVLSHCAYSYLGTITQYRHRPSLISLSFGIKYPGTAELLRGRDLIH
jgi:hypothetical protein